MDQGRVRISQRGKRIIIPGVDKTQWCPMERDFYDIHLDPRDYRLKTA